MAAKDQREKEASSSEEDEGTPAEKLPSESIGCLRTPALEEEVEDERSVALTASKNEVNGLDIDPQEDDPLPGWTTSGKRIHQCSDPGDQHIPVVGTACPISNEGNTEDYQEPNDAAIFIFIITMYLISKM